MSDNEKLRALLAEARGLISRNRLLLGEYEGPQELSKLTNRIDAALAEPVVCSECERLKKAMEERWYECHDGSEQACCKSHE